MTASIYNDLFDLRDVGGDMENRIKALGVYHIFGPLAVAHSQEPTVFNGLLFYILECYSIESKSLVIEADWLGIKQTVFRSRKLPEKMERGVVLLADPLVAQCVRDYVDYQQAETFRHYCMLRDLYTQLLDIALQSKEVDDKYKAQKYSREILTEIETFKSKLKADFQLLSKDESALPKQKAISSNIVSLEIEDYATGKDGQK